MTNRFENREVAGKILAEKLLPFQDLYPVILALPRGGVPIAHEIALKLQTQIDVILVKKIGAPGHEEYAIGAVAEDEKPILNQKVIKQNKFDPIEIENIIVSRITENRKRAKMYRKNFSAIPLKGRNVIVVDDGLATGATMIAAVEWLKTQHVKKIIVATPVSSIEAEKEVSSKVDQFVTLLTPSDFWAVGMWYKDFPQVREEEVIRLLQNHPQNIISEENEIWIEDGSIGLKGVLNTPENSKGIILFAHGGGSSHKSPRNLFVSNALNEAGFSTLLFDLLTPNEAINRKNIFDINLMAKRLLMATSWTHKNFPNKPIAFFGASTGAAAALEAASNRSDIFAVVSRGGRPDLAQEYLSKVNAPTLLIVGSNDTAILDANQKAKNHLPNSQILFVSNAGHLFEEPGALEQVVEYSLSWFTNSLSLHLTRGLAVQERIVDEIEENSIPFTHCDELDFWIKQISKNKIIMLGESSHGTKEFYSLRKEISKKLIQNYGYSFIAVEGDWPDCYKLNEYIKSTTPYDPRAIVKSHFHRWPTWMWANDEIPSLIHWMKNTQKGGFYGLDVYSLFESIDEVKKHLDHIDPVIAHSILEGFKCFESYQCDEIAYAKSLIKMPSGCQEEVISNLRSLLRLRLHETSLTKEALFDTKQNAKVISNAEKYYRAMITGGAESWNIRDNHMMDTLDNLLTNHGPDAKAIVWAHNTHIGDYHATDMVDNGYLNLGGLAREKYGIENVFLLGFGTNEGEVTAGHTWGGVETKMKLPPAPKGTYENYFHQAAQNMNSNQFLTTFDTLDKESSLYRKLGHRAVGVVYDPDHESRGNYVPTHLAKRYDAFLFVDKTNALKPIPSTFVVEEFPETWPMGQ